MKNSLILYLLCFCLSAFWMSCEKADLQKASKDDKSITERTDDCENCPIDDCCCAVELNGSSAADLIFCGTHSGIGLCNFPNPPGPCSAFSNGGTHFSLNSSTPYGVFCMVKGNSFSIYNNAVGSVSVKVSCQHDQTHPQTLTVTIPGGTYYYFLNNSDCELTQCQ
jgi:hypothetical protein